MSKTTRIITFFFTVSMALTSCQEEKSCYDEALHQQHKDDLCLENCPGVIGCDGKTYCNACIARAQGIEPE